MLRKFIIERNAFLRTDTVGYFSEFYTHYREPGNPDYLNVLKNTFNDISYNTLQDAKNLVVNNLIEALPKIIAENKLDNCIVVCIPRAKNKNSYTANQLLFCEAVSTACQLLENNVIDGTDVIIRNIDTKTTHLSRTTNRRGYMENSDKVIELIGNDGEEPYPGITKDTCYINKYSIINKDIILIDDIYTKTINIDEDAIQALYDNGAKSIIFYSIAYTGRENDIF